MLTCRIRTQKLSSGITRSPPFRPDPLDQFSFVLTQLLTWKPTINCITKFKILNLSNFNTNVGTFIADVAEQTIES